MTGSCRFSPGFSGNCERLCFVRRVFSLLIFALMLMFVQIMLVIVEKGIKSFLTEHYWMVYIGGTVFICTCMILSCSNVARSVFPFNFILFLALVESMTLALAVFTATFNTKLILIVLASEALIFLLLLILALSAPIDFAKWNILIVAGFLILFTFSISALINVYSVNIPVIEIIYALIAVTVLTMAMLLNLQVLFNAEIFELCPSDFILGAILMFADVIIFLMCCLKLVGFDTDE